MLIGIVIFEQFFESEPYQAYIEYLDKAGGFYSERWGTFALLPNLLFSTNY